jgi:type I restriction enzyme S subunit
MSSVYGRVASACAAKRRTATPAPSSKPTTRLTLSKLGAAKFPLSLLAEQFRIVIRVNELRSLCADLRQRLTFAQTSQSQLAQVLVEHHSTTIV